MPDPRLDHPPLDPADRRRLPVGHVERLAVGDDPRRAGKRGLHERPVHQGLPARPGVRLRLAGGKVHPPDPACPRYVEEPPKQRDVPRRVQRPRGGEPRPRDRLDHPVGPGYRPDHVVPGVRDVEDAGRLVEDDTLRPVERGLARRSVGVPRLPGPYRLDDPPVGAGDDDPVVARITDEQPHTRGVRRYLPGVVEGALYSGYAPHLQRPGGVTDKPADRRAKAPCYPLAGCRPDDLPRRIDEGERRPAPDIKGLPEPVIAVDSDRVPRPGAPDRLGEVPGDRGGL
ncbi:hypothetical protein DSECCO2_444290 [anaerobic digester metagenome]